MEQEENRKDKQETTGNALLNESMGRTMVTTQCNFIRLMDSLRMYHVLFKDVLRLRMTYLGHPVL